MITHRFGGRFVVNLHVDHVRFLVLAAFLCPSVALAQIDLTQLSLEQLMNLDVTSVSKKEEKWSEAPAAITVITGDDIRRLGATSIPEALRGVPGLHVARGSSSDWAVASRGFSSINSSKLLVLIDGRSVYTPLFSGVFWDVQDVALEDIDRIEVIRGPGASLWGANAMNGVINVITKKSSDTQGTYVEGGGGTFNRAFATARYGGSLGEKSHYRAYAKYDDRAAGFIPPNGDGQSPDDWQMGRGGFRTDWGPSDNDALRLSGDFYTGEIGQIEPSVSIIGRPQPPFPLRAYVAGGNALASWSRRLGEGSDLALKLYYDRTHRNDPAFDDDLDTYDLDFQNRLSLPLNQEFIWGMDFRTMVDDFQGKGIAALDPPRSTDHLYSGFLQDQFSVLNHALRLTFGSKFEHNDFSGFEIQPSGRFAWEPIPDHTFWGAVSRAVRVPTRLERDVVIDAADPASNPLPKLLGNHDLDSEDLLSYELGYRMPIVKTVYADASGFYNRYSHLYTLELDNPFTDASGKTIFPILNKSDMSGDAHGAELALTYKPEKVSWKVTASYTWFLLNLNPTGLDINKSARFEGATPTNQATLWASVPLPRGFALNTFLHYAGKLTTPGGQTEASTPAYADMDVRLSWQFTKSLELSLVGQNLLHAHHQEFPGGSDISRAMYGKISARL